MKKLNRRELALGMIFAAGSANFREALALVNTSLPQLTIIDGTGSPPMPVKAVYGQTLLQVLAVAQNQYRRNFAIQFGTDPTWRNNDTHRPIPGQILLSAVGLGSYSQSQKFRINGDIQDDCEWWLLEAPLLQVSLSGKVIPITPAEFTRDSFLTQVYPKPDPLASLTTAKLALQPIFIPPQLRGNRNIMARYGSMRVPHQFALLYATEEWLKGIR